MFGHNIKRSREAYRMHMKMKFIIMQVALFILGISAVSGVPLPGFLSYLETKWPSIFRARNAEVEAARTITGATDHILTSSSSSTANGGSIKNFGPVPSSTSSSKTSNAITKQQVTKLKRQQLNLRALQEASAANSNAQKKLIAYKRKSRTDKRITPALIEKLEREAAASKLALQTAIDNLDTQSKQVGRS